ncbi:hypothetical protein CHS0354_013240 [Potamilus streckersoni]|uniref:Uncharacterized protein n=1 Tax=Potamilus streckersoni TaxID=2493646 RepID=A0AAE0T220_9BIVA|nr:hypothetical protein CHS0354_013240 [Potamilus streckersoni]
MDIITGIRYGTILNLQTDMLMLADDLTISDTHILLRGRISVISKQHTIAKHKYMRKLLPDKATIVHSLHRFKQSMMGNVTNGSHGRFSHGLLDNSSSRKDKRNIMKTGDILSKPILGVRNISQLFVLSRTNSSHEYDFVSGITTAKEPMQISTM